MKIPSSDTEYRETIIEKVEKNKEGYSLTYTDGWSFYCPGHEFTPKKGMKVKSYGKGIGFQVRGLEIDGTVIFYRTKDQEESRFEEERQKIRNREKRELDVFNEKMKTAPYQVETIDISGFGRGGVYEDGCQEMLTKGLIYLSKHPGFKWKYRGYENVYGILSAKNKDGEELDKAIEIGDQTGAMHQAVVSHLMAIWQKGYQGWLKSHTKRAYKISDKDRLAVVDFPSMVKDP